MYDDSAVRMMKCIVAVLFAAIVAVAAYIVWDFKTRPELKVTGEMIERYRVLGYNPPKHFYIDLQHVSTGQVLRRVYVSKHCNSYRSIHMGEEYNLRVQMYVMSDAPTKVQYRFVGLEAAFCG